MTRINILFLGASKRVTLLENFLVAAKKINADIEIYSCELSDNFYPISHLANILIGPSFDSNNFNSWLQKIIIKHSINLIIPNMDSATVALSKFKNEFYKIFPNTLIAVSDYDLCLQCENKLLSEKLFQKNHVLTPTNTPNIFPKIVKPSQGYGAKNQFIVYTDDELNSCLHNNHCSKNIVQDYIIGQETTVDFYINKSGILLGYTLRDRLEVSDGEVMVCQMRAASQAEDELINGISKWSGWYGCVTLQYITTKTGVIYVTEINPRFGGGVTCSIKAGLNMPEYLLKETSGQVVSEKPSMHMLFMTRARRDFYYEQQ